MLGHLVIGAGQDEAPVGVVGVARPHLVPDEHVLVAVPVGAGPQRGQVRAGVGLAEALAPPVPPVDDAGQEAAPHVVAPVLEDALDQVAEARAGRCSGRGQLLVDDDVVDGRQALAADLRRPGRCRRSRRRRATGARRPGRPSTRRRSTRRAGRDCSPRATRRRRSRKAASSGESPKSMVASDPVVGQHPLEAGPDPAEELGWRGGPAAGRHGPGTPRCCRCRRAPGSRSRTRCGPPGRSRPWPPPPAARASSAGRASTAHAACRATLRDPSIRHVGVGQQVLDGLERADGPPELLAGPGVARRPGRWRPA